MSRQFRTLQVPAAAAAATWEYLPPVDRLFYSYADNSTHTIGPEGIESLCSDLGVDYTDVRVLMLAWIMQAQKQGYFTLQEWRRGLNELGGADSIVKLKRALPGLEKKVRKPPSPSSSSSNFVDFYRYAFNYCLTEELQRGVDVESVCLLLEIILGGHPQIKKQLVEYLVLFLREQTDLKVITLDQWMGFYRFCTEISYPDFSNYDPDVAWSWILDDFVEWMRSKSKPRR